MVSTINNQSAVSFLTLCKYPLIIRKCKCC